MGRAVMHGAWGQIVPMMLRSIPAVWPKEFDFPKLWSIWQLSFLSCDSFHFSPPQLPNFGFPTFPSATLLALMGLFVFPGF